MVGSILGAAAALLRENLDRGVRTAVDLESLGRVRPGSIPKADRPQAKGEIALASLDDPQAPAYQKVRSSLEFIAAGQNLRSIAVTSGLQNEGKTTSAANVATAMAQANTRTILVDCDLRRPRIHKVFRID